MMTRAEKLFCIRAQVVKAASDIDHGDTYGSCLALGDALSGLVKFLEEEMPEQSFNEPISESLKRPLAFDPETRAALDTLRAESTKIKRR